MGGFVGNFLLKRTNMICPAPLISVRVIGAWQWQRISSSPCSDWRHKITLGDDETRGWAQNPTIQDYSVDVDVRQYMTLQS